MRVILFTLLVACGSASRAPSPDATTVTSSFTSTRYDGPHQGQTVVLHRKDGTFVQVETDNTGTITTEDDLLGISAIQFDPNGDLQVINTYLGESPFTIDYRPFDRRELGTLSVTLPGSYQAGADYEISGPCLAGVSQDGSAELTATLKANCLSKAGTIQLYGMAYVGGELVATTYYEGSPSMQTLTLPPWQTEIKELSVNYTGTNAIRFDIGVVNNGAITHYNSTQNGPTFQTQMPPGDSHVAIVSTSATFQRLSLEDGVTPDVDELANKSPTDMSYDDTNKTISWTNHTPQAHSYNLTANFGAVTWGLTKQGPQDSLSLPKLPTMYEQTMGSLAGYFITSVVECEGAEYPDCRYGTGPAKTANSSASN